MKNIYDIIVRPVITEQSMSEVADKKYVFMVDINANKTEIKAAVEEVFGVKVAKVNTLRQLGKVKRTGAYPKGKRCIRCPRGLCNELRYSTAVSFS